MPASFRLEQEGHALKSSVPGTHAKKLDMVAQAVDSFSGDGDRNPSTLTDQLGLCGEFRDSK